MSDDDYAHGDSNAKACQACPIEAIYQLWAAAMSWYYADLRAAYRTGADPHSVRRDFENGCRQLRRLIEPPGFELAIVRKALIRRLVEAKVLTTNQAANLAD